MKKLAILLLAVLLLTGCAADPISGTTVPGSLQTPTVDNIFTMPPQDTGDGEDVYENMSFAFEFAENYIDRTEELGRHARYQGGEMHQIIQFVIGGSWANDGVGLLLLLDGIPQPYKTTNHDTYAYTHTFYPPSKEGGDIYVEVIFAPVTGKTGDSLRLTALSLTEPDLNLDSLLRHGEGHSLTNLSMFTGVQVIFEADPPEITLPETRNRVTALSIQEEDLTAKDIAGWSAEDLKNRASFLFDVGPGKESYKLYGITPETKIRVHAEVFSPSFVDWRLVVYMGNKPVSVLDRDDVSFSVPNGKKVLIDMELDISDYDGYIPLYAILEVRNRRFYGEMAGTSLFTEYTLTYHLVEPESREAWAALREEYGKE